MTGDRPSVTMVTPTADAAARRIVSLTQIRSLTGIPASGSGAMADADLELLLDGVLADCAASCRVVRVGAYPLTLAEEVIRARWVDTTIMPYAWRTTWLPLGCRSNKLLLPWRVPITDLVVTEGDTVLVQDVDYQDIGAGVLERLSSSYAAWTTGAIEVEITAGWQAGEDPEYPVPANLVSAIADQVRYKKDQRGMDLTLRSEDVAGVWSGSYNVPGGDSISSSGLLRPLEDALALYRAPPSLG